MKLNEFFSKPMEIRQKGKEQTTDNMKDDLYWYMLDHDRLHKDYFLPIAKKIKGLKECGDDMVLELYMPMVVKGCKEYHKKNQMEGKLGKKFPKELRDELCRKLHSHFFKDVQSNKYKLGR